MKAYPLPFTDFLSLFVFVLNRQFLFFFCDTSDDQSFLSFWIEYANIGNHTPYAPEYKKTAAGQTYVKTSRLGGSGAHIHSSRAISPSIPERKRCRRQFLDTRQTARRLARRCGDVPGRRIL